MPKITFIGAGSFGFTRNLVRDVLTFERLAGSTICLMDINPERLEYSRRAVQRIVDEGHYPAQVETTMDRAAALTEMCIRDRLGTDRFGRDVFGRAAVAGRISLTMALFGTLISVLVGSVVGVFSGYYGGGIDNWTQRFVEFVQSFPQLPLWMALAAVIPISWDQMAVFVTMSFIFALLSWTLLAREVRGKVLSLRETDFVLAAQEMGASDARIMFQHLLPNTFSHIIVVMTLTIPTIILAESFLSFLGIGIQEPLVSWGTMMRDAQTIQTLGFNPWIAASVFFIIAAVLGFNFLGDGLRDAADPYSTS